jgi:hypothetical protein
VRDRATTAGYAVRRFYDTATGRWFVYGYDTTSFGQAYFFINPFAKRNVVIEVPHEDLEYGTKVEGVRLFRALAARALVVNKEHRCSDPDTSSCSVGQSTNACAGRLRESDVAHHTANTFYLLHKRYTDMDAVTKFVQLHGMGGSSGDMVEVGDGTTRDSNAASVSVNFANNLDRYVPAPSAVDSCQEYAGDPPSALCAETNVEARYTHNHDASDCPASASIDSGRFLDIEQAGALRRRQRRLVLGRHPRRAARRLARLQHEQRGDGLHARAAADSIPGAELFGRDHIERQGHFLRLPR